MHTFLRPTGLDFQDFQGPILSTMKKRKGLWMTSSDKKEWTRILKGQIKNTTVSELLSLHL